MLEIKSRKKQPILKQSIIDDIRLFRMWARTKKIPSRILLLQGRLLYQTVFQVSWKRIQRLFSEGRRNL